MFIKNIFTEIINHLKKACTKPISLFINVMLILLCTQTFSQTLMPKVVATSGKFYNNPQGSLSVTIGELASIKTLTNNSINLILTQGFQQNAVSTSLPVKLIEFKAVKNTRFVTLNWKAINESEIQSYTIQRSSNGTDFTNIGKVDAKNIGSFESSYSYNDTSLLAYVIYYRIYITEKTDNNWYSWVVCLRDNYSPIKVFPIPADNIIYLEVSSKLNEYRELRLYDILGNLIWKKIFYLNTGINSIAIDISKQLAGSYLLVGLGEQQIKILKK